MVHKIKKNVKTSTGEPNLKKQRHPTGAEALVGCYNGSSHTNAGLRVS